MNTNKQSPSKFKLWLDVHKIRLLSVVALILGIFTIPLLGVITAGFAFGYANEQKQTGTAFYDKRDWVFALVTLIITSLLFVLVIIITISEASILDWLSEEATSAVKLIKKLSFWIL